jgi:hypothetical protein
MGEAKARPTIAARAKIERCMVKRLVGWVVGFLMGRDLFLSGKVKVLV